MRNLVYLSIVNLVQDITSLFWGITVVGGIIISALAYVSWVKYKEEKNRQKRKSNS
ncbi:sporulation protein YpjB [Virgibacillus flavescens]|uniref:sporulation protein YpjB n=1 Tax=Virgibacillus flavescens TaxID=1611422 RepID=UPI003D3312D5